MIQGVPIYPPKCIDFSTNGLGLMLPTSCTVDEELNGMYELTMEQPITGDLRWMQVQTGCILKAPCPTRETPLYEGMGSSGGTTTTVTRSIYRVSTPHGGRLRLRQKPSTSSRILGMYRPGTQVAAIESVNADWFRVSVVKGGAAGYMAKKYLAFVKDVTDTIVGSTPVTQNGVKVLPARDQLFRVYSVENDSDAGVQTVHAMHITYDLRTDYINREYDPEGERADTALHTCWDAQAVGEFDLQVADLPAKVTGGYGYQSVIEAFLDPDEGIITQAGALLVRDNFSLYAIPDAVRDMGVTIRRRKNLVGVSAETDDSDVVTRITPCGADKKGDPLFLDGQRYVDSPRINDYATVRAKKIDYPVRVSDAKDSEFPTNAAARAELRRLAEAEFSAGVDLPAYGMDVDFVMLDATDDFAGLQSVHLGDTVTVIDSVLGLTAKVRATSCAWNVLSQQYDRITLGSLQSLTQRTYGFSLPNGGVNGNKLAGGTVDGSALRDLTIEYAKIAVATVKQLNAESINALTARIDEIVAGEITTDKLYASLAEIVTLMVGSITADNIDTDRLSAVLGDFVKLYADYAGIDFADIRDLIADEAIIRRGIAQELYVDRLAVTSANLVSAIISDLVLRGSDGKYYHVSVDANGILTATEVELTPAEIEAGKTSDGQTITDTTVNADDLTAGSLQASEAIIAKIFTDALTAGNITAGQAMIASASIPMLYATSIKSLGDSIDLTANTSIRLLFETNDLLQSWFTFTPDGMEVGKKDSTYSTLTDDTGFHIRQLGGKIGSFAKRQLSAEAVRVGRIGSTEPRMVLREAPDGGLMITREDI